MQQESEGIWRATMFAHPVLLVSVQELPVERDSMALHVLAGVPAQARGTLADVLKAEPALLDSFREWLATYEPELWKEVSPMATGQEQIRQPDFTLLVDFAKETGSIKRLIEIVGVQQAIEYLGFEEVLKAMGVEKVVESLGPQAIWTALSQRDREELLRVAGRDNSGEASNTT